MSVSIDLSKISRLVSKKLARKIVFSSCEKIGSGYHSDGFLLSTLKGEKYFLKKFKSNDLGFEIPDRKLHSLLLGHIMAGRGAPADSPRPIGVIVSNKDEEMIMPEIDAETEFFHVQEFGGEGENYYSRLLTKKSKRKLDDADKKEIDAIVDLAATIHSKQHPSKDAKELKTIYNGGIRSVLIHPELTMMFLHDFTEGHEILTLKAQKEFVGLMLELIHHFKDRSDRLTALHGDFWGANVFSGPTEQSG